MIVVTGIPKERVEEFWSRLERLTLKACLAADMNHTPISVKHAAMDGLMGVWAAWDVPYGEDFYCETAHGGDWLLDCVGLAFTELGVYPSGRKVMEVTLCAGEGVNGWVNGLDQIEADAREKGCSQMLINGRRGWARVLNGYEDAGAILRKDLCSEKKEAA